MQTNNNQKLFKFIIVLLIINAIILLFILMKFWWSNRIEETPEMKKKQKICLIEELQLRDDQIDVFIDLRKEHYQKMEELFQMHKQKRMELIDYIEEHPEVTLDDVKRYADSLGNIETRIQVQAIEYFLSVRTILDSAQFSIFLNRFRKLSGCDRMDHKHYCKKKINPK